MVMNFVSLWEIYPTTTLNRHTHRRVHIFTSTFVASFEEKCFSNPFSRYKHCLFVPRAELCWLSDCQTPLSALSDLFSPPFPHHSNIIFLLVPFCIHCGSTCFSTSPLSVYYKAHRCKHFWIQVILPGKNKVWKCRHLKMLMVASIR